MCGIFGYFSKDKINQSPWLEKCSRLLQLRGPDDYGFSFRDTNSDVSYFTQDLGSCAPSNVGFGHRRLSILDLSSRGRQPLVCSDSGSMLTYNGEVYNYIELRDDLLKKGYTFQTDTDTEVVFISLLHYGIEAVKKFQGMYAIAWYDAAHDNLHLLRDPFAIKPLYYSVQNNVFIFGSQQNTLLAFDGVSKTLDSQSFYNYVRFGVNDDGESTLYKNIHQVKPGYCYTIHNNDVENIQKTLFWKPTFESNKHLSFGSACDQLREIFLNSVKIHMRCDVPLAATLSGGIDSSAIVCCMRKLYPELPINTYSYTPKGYSFDESKFAEIIVKQVGSQARYVDLPSFDFINELDDMLNIQEDPFGGFSHYASRKLFHATSLDGFKVVLSGQGGDEIFAGYPIYFAIKVAMAIRNKEWSKVVHWLINFKSVGGGHSSGFLLAFEHLLPVKYSNILRNIMGKPVWPKYLRKTSMADTLRLGRLEPKLNESGLHGMLYETMTRTCLPNLLHYDDRNSMSYSQESRVPFLITDVVDFALSLPEHYLIGNDGVTKKVFRESMRGIVPDVILDRKDKVGFHTPRAEFLLANPQWVENTLKFASSQWPDVFDLRVLREYWSKMLAGMPMVTMDFWRVLCFIHWSKLRSTCDFG